MQQARVVPLLAAESVVFRLPLRPSRLRWCRSVVARSFRPSQVPVCATSPRRPARSTRPTMPRTCHPTPKAVMRPTCVRPRARSSLLLRVVCTRSLTLSLSLALTHSGLCTDLDALRPYNLEMLEASMRRLPEAIDIERFVQRTSSCSCVSLTLSHMDVSAADRSNIRRAIRCTRQATTRRHRCRCSTRRLRSKSSTPTRCSSSSTTSRVPTNSTLRRVS